MKRLLEVHASGGRHVLGTVLFPSFCSAHWGWCTQIVYNDSHYVDSFHAQRPSYRGSLERTRIGIIWYFSLSCLKSPKMRVKHLHFKPKSVQCLLLNVFLTITWGCRTNDRKNDRKKDSESKSPLFMIQDLCPFSSTNAHIISEHTHNQYQKRSIIISAAKVVVTNSTSLSSRFAKPERLSNQQCNRICTTPNKQNKFECLLTMMINKSLLGLNWSGYLLPECTDPTEDRRRAFTDINYWHKWNVTLRLI
jgi:hypothetical protein